MFTAVRIGVFERQATPESGVDLVPVGNLLFTQPPAELDGSAIHDREEIDDATFPVLEVASDLGELVDQFLERVEFVRILIAEIVERLHGMRVVGHFISSFDSTYFLVLSDDFGNDSGNKRKRSIGRRRREDLLSAEMSVRLN